VADWRTNESSGRIAAEEAKPVCKKGRRNVFCPNYGYCLDYVIKLSWGVWSCCECEHLSDEEGRREISLMLSDSPAYFELPPDIYRKV
jgi:hypothetical protein